MRQWLQRNVLKNAGIKLASLALAIILYLHVFASQEREAVLAVPLALGAVPVELTWTGELVPAAQVRFRGSGLEILKLRSRLAAARLEVDASEARAGLYQRPLVAEDVRIPADIDVQVVRVESPRDLSLHFDRRLLRRLPVSARVGGRPAPGFIVFGEIVVEPDSVTVRGPDAKLATFDQVRTAALDLNGARDTVTRRVSLQAPAECEVAPAEVTVRVSLERVVSRTFSGLPVEVLRSGDVIRKSLKPETGKISVSGPESLVEALRSEDLRLSIDARDFPPGIYSLMASVELLTPLGAGSISIEPVEPEAFEVVLE